MNGRQVRWPYRPAPRPEPWIPPVAWFLVGVLGAIALGLWAT